MNAREERRGRVLAVLTSTPHLAAVLTGQQLTELVDRLLTAVTPDEDLALRAELARGSGSGWVGRRWVA